LLALCLLLLRGGGCGDECLPWLGGQEEEEEEEEGRAAILALVRAPAVEEGRTEKGGACVWLLERGFAPLCPSRRGCLSL